MEWPEALEILLEQAGPDPILTVFLDRERSLEGQVLAWTADWLLLHLDWVGVDTLALVPWDRVWYLEATRSDKAES